MLKAKDERMKLTTETFNSIKLLKLYNWENEFKTRILEARNVEMQVAKKLLNLFTMNVALFWSAPVIVSIATIGVYQYLNDRLDIGNMLIGLTIFGMLQIPIRDLPVSINSVIETLISIKRVEVNLIFNFRNI